MKRKFDLKLKILFLLLFFPLFILQLNAETPEPATSMSTLPLGIDSNEKVVEDFALIQVDQIVYFLSELKSFLITLDQFYCLMPHSEFLKLIDYPKISTFKSFDKNQLMTKAHLEYFVFFLKIYRWHLKNYSPKFWEEKTILPLENEVVAGGAKNCKINSKTNAMKRHFFLESVIRSRLKGVDVNLLKSRTPKEFFMENFLQEINARLLI
jgi:hypothetical protein